MAGVGEALLRVRNFGGKRGAEIALLRPRNVAWAGPPIDGPEAHVRSMGPTPALRPLTLLRNPRHRVIGNGVSNRAAVFYFEI